MVFSLQKRPATASGKMNRIAASHEKRGGHKSLMPKFDKHIFVCGNQRPPGHPRGCCDPTAEARLQKLFKQKLAERGLKGPGALISVRANQSGCLDQCEHGPTVVVYPDAVWYGHVTEADVEEIVESHILGGKPVERLRLANSCLNTATCEHRKPELKS
jgi:(2Fe-2S) ferredoxin